MIDISLIERLKILADKEKKIKAYKRRLRIKGKIVSRGVTKNGNITLNIKKDENDYKFTVLKSHKERFALAEKLNINRSVAIEGVLTFRTIICTRLKAMEKGVSEGRQTKLI